MSFPNLICPLLFYSVFFISCQSSSKENKENQFILEPIKTHCISGGEPNLFVEQTGDIYLSWIEYTSDTTDALVFSKMENGKWGEPTVIAQGSDWFVNWADFPSVAARGNWLAAHWLQKSAAGTYDYDVRIAQSLDSGKTWSPSFIPHQDSISAEHGFVTMMPISDDRMFVVWLDGRNTKTHPQSGDGHGHGGAMTLRTAEFDKSGNLYEESELDNRICDCCQTDAAMTANGPVVVYRDRSEHEIRDICIVRKVEGKWTVPHLIHADNWEITGCPVNGPAIVADGDLVAVAWFSAPKGKNMVNIAFSEDAGATFNPSVRVDDGNPSGRVDVEMMDEQTVLVSWLENANDTAEIRVAKVSLKGKTGKSITLTSTTPARSSGFPILAKMDKKWLLAWTEVDSETVVKTGIIH